MNPLNFLLPQSFRSRLVLLVLATVLATGMGVAALSSTGATAITAATGAAAITVGMTGAGAADSR